MKLTLSIFLLASLTASAQKDTVKGEVWIYTNEVIYQYMGFALNGKYYFNLGANFGYAEVPQLSKSHMCYFNADKKRFRRKYNFWSSEIYHYEKVPVINQ